MQTTARRPRILAVTSGKGGVGKTNFAVNISVCLRMFGVDVLLLDADIGLGNVDVLLGLDTYHDLRDCLLGGKPVEHVVVQGPRGLRILPGASGVEALTTLEEPKIRAFLEQVRDYCANMDYVVIDTSPGISAGVLACLECADEILLVTSPEPTAITDAYALLKVMDHRGGERRPVSVVMNQTCNREEAVRSFDRLRITAERFLRRPVDYLGAVTHDPTVREATRRQVDFLTHYEDSDCTRDVRKIAARLVSAGPAGEGDVGRFFQHMMEGARE